MSILSVEFLTLNGPASPPAGRYKDEIRTIQSLQKEELLICIRFIDPLHVQVCGDGLIIISLDLSHQML
jgi:hypothetical protein